MFFNDGMNPNEIGDFEVVEHNGKLHAFYLVLSNHDSVGHLESADGINWKHLPPAIHTGNPGEFDDDQIWTMGVVKKGDTWFMLYTANQKNGKYQVTGLATSKDLITWKKYAKNPVAAPDGRWYEAVQRGRYRVDWRDPHIIERDGKLHAFLCAREKSGLRNHRGCAGYFTSTDGYKWTVQPPACTPRNSFDYECPSVFELAGRYYMVAIHGGHNRGTYRVADRVEGPYRRPFDDSLMPDNNLSIRPCMFRGKVHLFHWNRGPVDWPSRLGSFACLSSPKAVRADADGNLTVESFDWSAQHAGKAQAVTPRTPGKGTCGKWKWQGGSLTGASEFGTGVWLTNKSWTDFEIQADVELASPTDACEFGITFRSDEQGDQATYARCIPGRYTCELVKQIHNRNDGPESLWRGRSVCQSFHFTPAADGKYRLRLIAFGPNIELNVNGRLVLSELTMARRDGRLGVFVEDGSAKFTNIRITPIKEPTTKWN